MPNTAKVQFNVKNFTPGVSTPLPGIIYVIGITKRGPVLQPEYDIMNNWSQFERTFGGLLSTSDFPLLCKRALMKGARLRVCRVNATSTPSVIATAKTLSNADGSAKQLFTVQPKHKGVDYNNFTCQIKTASNGNALYWNLELIHALEPDLNEIYENIAAFNIGVANTQTCLDKVKQLSANFNFTYLDASTAVLKVPVATTASAFTGGVDPAGYAAGDYTAAMNEFNDVDDGIILAVPEMDTTAINTAGLNYAAGRGDIVYFAHLSNSIITAANLAAERVSIAAPTKNGALFAGGIKVRDERTLVEKSISEMGDVLGIAANVQANYGAWYSLAGANRGSVSDATGVVTNFGTPGGFTDLNTLANNQINMMVVKNGIVQISGNFSSQYTNDQEKFLNVVFLVLWMKKAMKPILESYLEEPNDPITFRKIYNHLKPFLDKLTSPDYRALYKYEYYGDQDANTLADLQLNNAVDVQNGKYKINLKIWPIPSLQELTFNLMLVQGEGVYIS
jgi:hypothetical protein